MSHQSTPKSFALSFLGTPWRSKEFKGAPIETSELLGKVTVPADLTMEALKEEVPLLSGVVNGDSSTLVKALLEEHKGREYEVWPKLMSEWLLRNFDGLDSLEAYMALEEDLKRIREDNPQLEKKRFLTPRTDKPTNLHHEWLLAGTSEVRSFQ